MLFRFPPARPAIHDPTFLSGASEVFAKLKIESKAGKRTVFITEHTLIFVISGIKLLHFPDQTLKITPDSVIFLKKGIYVMAEYVEAGLTFEALMLFLPEPVLQSFISGHVTYAGAKKTDPFFIFPANRLMHDFKNQLRQYFEHPLFNYQQLIPLKQREILTLLLSSGYKEQALAFIHSAVSRDLREMDAVIQAYILQPVTIAELANLCNRSLAAFKRDFQKQYHEPPKTYINKQRLHHGRMLLQNTGKPISEIAADCAFESPSYFIRVFKQRFGATPQRMRAKIAIE
ncbi:MAG: helix-turn-helix domain-containing protein [Chitinophagaceae bacterium]|nr:helix-turn-helix domain-containing protein [Chitinophagaceae bacterium]